MIFAIFLTFVLIAFAVLAWQDLKFALILLCGLTPTYLVRFDVGPIPTTLLECLLLITLATFVIRYRSRLLTWTKRKPKFTLASISLILIAISSIVAVVIAPNHISALGIWKAYYLEPFLFAVIAYSRFDRTDYKKLFIALCTSGIVVALFAIIQVTFHIGIPEAWITENRATSFFPYPNAVGLLLAPIVSAMIAFLSTSPDPSLLRRGVRGRNGILVVAALFLVTIGLAKTEAALVAIPTALFIVAIMTPLITKKTKILGTIGAATVFLFIFTFLPTIASKLTLNDASGLVRRTQWSETLHMLADHAYLGVGLNGYPTALVPYHNPTLYEIFQYPHNIFLNVWSELGLIGLIGLIGLMSFSLHFTWQNKKDPWVLACFAALLTMFIHGLVDVPFSKNDLAIMTALFCVAMITKKSSKES
ncbi:MAG: O-antigen ligase family protein [Patescibacteria group bacterium]